jgi:hypothetical protein
MDNMEQHIADNHQHARGMWAALHLPREIARHATMNVQVTEESNRERVREREQKTKKSSSCGEEFG